MKTLPLITLTTWLLLNFPATSAGPLSEIDCLVDGARSQGSCFLDYQRDMNRDSDSNKCCILVKYQYCLSQESTSCELDLESMMRSLGSSVSGCDEASLSSFDCLYYFYPVPVIFSLFFLGTFISLCLFQCCRSGQRKNQASNVFMMRQDNRGFRPPRDPETVYQETVRPLNVPAPSAPILTSSVDAQPFLPYNDPPPSYAEIQQKYKDFRQ